MSGSGITAEIVYQRAVAQYENVGAEELGIVYQEMLQEGQRSKRKDQGSYYTPDPLAAWTAKAALGQAIAQVGPEPEQVMRVIALDPSCGAGIFLVHAARQLSIAYAARLSGGEPSGDLVLAVMPRVVLNCVFGVDIDPVAADLAKLSLSLETAGAITPVMLDRHIICGNVLDGDSPPAMEERRAACSRPDLEEAA